MDRCGNIVSSNQSYLPLFIRQRINWITSFPTSSMTSFSMTLSSMTSSMQKNKMRWRITLVSLTAKIGSYSHFKSNKKRKEWKNVIIDNSQQSKLGYLPAKIPVQRTHRFQSLRLILTKNLVELTSKLPICGESPFFVEMQMVGWCVLQLCSPIWGQKYHFKVKSRGRIALSEGYFYLYLAAKR